MYFRFFLVFRGEKSVELIFTIDLHRILFTEGQGSVVKILLDLIEIRDNVLDKFLSGNRNLISGGSVSSTHKNSFILHITRADLQSHSDTFLDPLPVFLAPVHITGVVFNNKLSLMISQVFQLIK